MNLSLSKRLYLYLIHESIFGFILKRIPYFMDAETKIMIKFLVEGEKKIYK